MCFFSQPSQPAPPPLPPAPPAPATMADPAVQAARRGEKDKARQGAVGLGSTRLNVNLGGQGAGKATTAGGVA